MVIRPAGVDDVAAWSHLRAALWPSASAEEHLAEVQDLLEGRHEETFLAELDGQTVGLAEVSLRHEYVSGCETSPVGFLEGLFVEPAYRGRGIARSLVIAAEAWARSHGCSEFASDADEHNEAGQAFHRATGFAEADRLVCYVKRI
jgi:aminoglycoside 6'-N-acetyltransferase I